MGPSQPLAYDWAKSARSMSTSMCIRAASATATQHAGRRLFFSLAALDPAGDGPDVQCSAGAAGIPLIAAKQPAAASHTSHGFGAAGASLVTMARSCSCCHLWRRRRRLVPLARPGAAAAVEVDQSPAPPSTDRFEKRRATLAGRQQPHHLDHFRLVAAKPLDHGVSGAARPPRSGPSRRSARHARR
jgi:hypothetical protein